jgi:hypothetical protein
VPQGQSPPGKGRPEKGPELGVVFWLRLSTWARYFASRRVKKKRFRGPKEVFFPELWQPLKYYNMLPLHRKTYRNVPSDNTHDISPITHCTKDQVSLPGAFYILTSLIG